MRTLIEIFAGVAILANAVIYGTDVFGAIVQRPSIAAVDDRTLTQSLGHIHQIADVRSKAIGSGGLIAAIATAALAAATGHWVSASAGALATLALLVFLALYTLTPTPQAPRERTLAPVSMFPGSCTGAIDVPFVVPRPGSRDADASRSLPPRHRQTRFRRNRPNPAPSP